MKSSLRHYYRQLRRSISSDEKILFSQAITKIFIKYIESPQKNIAVYLANDGEVDLKFLIEALWEKQHNVFLPVINTTTQHLEFAPYFPATIMKKNQYGINEPVGDLFISPEELDIVLLPLVAFDNTGARLGMGKGFYDKTFTFCHQPHDKPKLMGIAYSCQYCDKLLVEHWDVPLDGILTEAGLLMFTGKS